MSYRREKLSGAQYKNIAKLKAKKDEKVISQTPKLSNYFQIGVENNVDSRNCTSSHQTPLLEEGNINNAVLAASTIDKETDKEIDSEIETIETGRINDELECDFEPKLYHNRENQSCSSPVHESGINKNSAKDDNFVEEFNRLSIEVSDDPAEWKPDSQTLSEIIKRGFNQNMGADFSTSKRVIFGRNRGMMKTLFTRNLVNGSTQHRHWLIYSESKAAVFCGPCKLLGNPSLDFNSKGYNDWSNVHKVLESHEKSAAHKTNCLTYKMRSKKTIEVALTDEIHSEINYWKKLLRRLVTVIKALSSRGLAFRGHDEIFGSVHNGNYCMSLEMIAEYDPFLRDHIQTHANRGRGNVSYLSSTICEEFIRIMAKTALNKILSEIRSAKYFSISVDSTPDISHVDQLTFIVRYVQQNGIPIERFLEFIPNCRHTGADLANSILELLSSYEIDIANCRGQCYDNASNMSGIYSGVQANILRINPLAAWVPCAAHSLNLVGKWGAESSPLAVQFFLDLQELYNFFSGSTYRWELLKNFLEKYQTLKSLSITRWSARFEACKSLRQSYGPIIAILLLIAENPNEKPTTRAEARGIYNKLNKLESCFVTLVWYDIMDRFNSVSKILQSTKTELKDALELYESLIIYLSNMRHNFDLYEKKAIELFGSDVYENDGKRQCKRKRFFDEENSEDANYSRSACDNLRIEFFYKVLDTLISELQRRSKAYDTLNSDFGFLMQLFDLHSEDITKKVENLATKYPNDLDKLSLNLECQHLSSHLISLNVKAISGKELNQMIIEEGFLELYPNVNIALSIFLCLMITNCSGERSFSTLKRVHNYLRSTQSQERMNALSLLCIEWEITLSLDCDLIIHNFAEEKARKKLF